MISPITGLHSHRKINMITSPAKPLITLLIILLFVCRMVQIEGESGQNEWSRIRGSVRGGVRG